MLEIESKRLICILNIKSPYYNNTICMVILCARSYNEIPIKEMDIDDDILTLIILIHKGITNRESIVLV